MPEFQLGLELNKGTLLGHLFADFHFVFKKREKGNTSTVSVQVTTSICINCSPSAVLAGCKRQTFSYQAKQGLD